MGTLQDISLQQTRSGDLSPDHLLLIDGEDYSEKLIEVQVTYDADGGGSGSQLQISGDWEDYDNASVELHLGYGDNLTPYFHGTFMGPFVDRRKQTTSVNAYGPFKRMALSQLGRDKNYRNSTLGFVIRDCTTIAEYGSGVIKISEGADNRTLTGDDLYFPFTSKCGDVIKTVLDKHKWIGMDQPGNRRLFRPKPTLVATGRTVARYETDNYKKDGLDISRKEEVSYYSVIGVRRGTNGAVLNRIEQVIGHKLRFPPPRNRTYPIDPYEGTDLELSREVDEMSRYLLAGVRDFTLSITPNYELELFSGLELIARDGFPYKGFIDKQIVTSYRPEGHGRPGSSNMQVTGRALNLNIIELSASEEEIEGAPYSRPTPPPYISAPPVQAESGEQVSLVETRKAGVRATKGDEVNLADAGAVLYSVPQAGSETLVASENETIRRSTKVSGVDDLTSMDAGVAN